MNTLCPLSSEVSDEEIPLQLSVILQRRSFELVLTSTYGTTCVYFGVVTYVCGVEGLAQKVAKPITKLVVTRRDEPPLLAVKGVVDVKCCDTFIAMVW